MPLIDVYAVEDTLAPETASALLEELATILLRWEGAPDTEFFREITWVYLHPLPATALAVGGRPGGSPRFRVEITVPAGALSQRRKEGLVADVHAAVTAAAGLEPERALHVWTLIREVPDGNWGAAGQVIRFSDLLAVSGAEREKVAES
ncbi:tautomerase family protein [Nocardia puris]|uniref:Phenylpyruvate tautomerase PptA (4-oxalocrotonate tautomerase family) n=1 Tax=Nocardia puris TaxID=208602 RepID=A0A366DVL3_9NOCA|nr:tautomerase family protein [Nocardia puris]MBF6210110.1 tautomerase family protein [Nocardia puris]MBF6368301.1 tautomerase family protein [Nocardia puris]MBF6457981.1 tautomerase family protein [Nocardia puris]RBO94141.1 phenylpyruvate tautomerase PptA (4-oxalocrotonate tautomerase family) [Nocardia puris]